LRACIYLLAGANLQQQQQQQQEQQVSDVKRADTNLAGSRFSPFSVWQSVAKEEQQQQQESGRRAAGKGR